MKLRRWGRVSSVLVGVALVTAVLAGPASMPVSLLATAPAAAAADCTNGVIVAVDFSPWQNEVDSVCDPQLPSTAAYALQDAGFNPVGVASYGLAFICQIGGDPPEDPCQSTPPADAYWSFWYANKGQNTWTYSESGAMGLEPQAGSVEAWVFGGEAANSNPPIPDPDGVIEQTTALASMPTTTTTTTTNEPSPASGGDAGSSATAPPSQSAPPATTATTTAASPNSHAASPTTVSTNDPGNALAGKGTGHPAVSAHSGTHTSGSRHLASSVPRVVSVVPAAIRRPESGLPVSLIIGAMAIVVLAGSAAFVAVRRRRVE